MYLCTCKSVSDQQIRQAVEQGARSFGDLSVRFGIGIECGKCIDGINALLQECLSAAAPPPAGSSGGRPGPNSRNRRARASPEGSRPGARLVCHRSVILREKPHCKPGNSRSAGVIRLARAQTAAPGGFVLRFPSACAYPRPP